MVVPRSFYILPFASLAFGAIVTEVVTVTTLVSPVSAATARPVTKASPIAQAAKVVEIPQAAKVAEIPISEPATSASAVPQAVPQAVSQAGSSAEYNTDKSYTMEEDFQGAILNSTNAFRQQHGASSLVWNDTLASYAASHASDCVFKHTDGPYGENLAAGWSSIETAVDGWGNERASYDFASGGFGETTGHFTQLVWKTTTSVGCGRVYCNKPSTPGWYLMCEYYPRGNIRGSYQENVLSKT